MALVPSRDVAPITIDEALHSISHLILDVVKKNRTMIDYYIYPKDIPSEIEAYKPRLQILYARVESLSTFDLSKLTLIADHAEALVSAFLLPIVDQLLNAINGIQGIFIKYYDRDLKQRRPYGATFDALVYRQRQLKYFQHQKMTDPYEKLPETMISVPHSDSQNSFCRHAVAFTNHRDQGKLSQVLSEDLTGDEKGRLKKSGGAFLWWDCPGCAFRLKYHIVSSVSSSILSTDDVRTHLSAPGIEYRPSWLVKCHLYQHSSKERRGSADADDRDTNRSEARRGSTTEIRKGSIARRQSEVKSPRSSGSSFWFGTPKRRLTDVTGDRTTKSRGKDSVAKYGCPFCFVTGKEYGRMEYRNGRELSEHISMRHHFEQPPAALMLEKYMVGLDGQCADNVHRWELNLQRRYD